MTSTDPQSGSPDFTKRVRLVSELKAASFLGAMFLYCVFGYHLQVPKIVSSHVSNLNLQIVLCWLPLDLLCTFISLPVSFYNFYLQRKFGVLKLGIGGWSRDFLKASVLGFLFYGATLEIVYSSHAILKGYGWISSGILMAILLVTITRSSPWILSLFYPVVPLESGTLRTRLLALANKAGMNAGTILEWRISARTRQANAMVTGVGSARRILLTDTLISELTEEEVESLVAHEFGHCAHHHVAKRLLFQLLAFGAVFLAIDFFAKLGTFFFVEGDADWSDPSLIPGILFWWYVGCAIGNLFLAARWRKQENEADLYSWKLIGRAEPFITGMHKLTALNLITYEKGAERKYMHPATSSRIAAAEQFAKSNGESLATIPANVTVAPS